VFDFNSIIYVTVGLRAIGWYYWSRMRGIWLMVVVLLGLGLGACVFFGVKGVGISKTSEDGVWGDLWPGINDKNLEPTKLDSSQNNIIGHLTLVMLIIDEGVEVQIKDENMNRVQTQAAVLDPLLDDMDKSTTSGDVLKEVVIEKPADGHYTVILTGIGDYRVDWYLYEANGGVISGDYEGTFARGGDVYRLDVGTTSRFVKL